MDSGAEQRQKRTRRKFSDEFKAGAVRMVLVEGKPITRTASDLGISVSGLGRWVEQARADGGSSSRGTLTTEEKEELSRLRKEVGELRLEREILKKAAVRSGGQRNRVMVDPLDGATWTPRSIGTAEERSLVEVATRGVA
jgi:transposase